MKTTKWKSGLGQSLCLLALLMALVLAQAAPALAVTDIGNHWAKSTIESYISRGIVSGYTDGTFKPNNQITRAEFVAMVNKVFGFNTAGSISFKDVPSSSWAYSDIAKGVTAGYIHGTSTTTFSPNAKLTRQEAAVIIAQIKGVSADSSALLQYIDRGSIAPWASAAVGAVSKAGYMQGGGNGKFNPQAPMTRAEAVSVLAKAEAKNNISGVIGGGSSSGSYIPNNNVLHNTTSGSTSSSKDEDYTLGNNETRLRNKTITGDLIIPSSMGSKTINLEGLTVDGTVYVYGGGTINVDDCDFYNVVLDKSGVVFDADDDSRIDSVTFYRKGTIQGDADYGDVEIRDDDVTEATVNARVDYLLLDTDAKLRLGRYADIDHLEVTSNADNTDIIFTRGAYVDEMEIDDRVEISGVGEIRRMTVYVSGVYSSIEPDKLIISGSGRKPTYTQNTNSSNNNNNNNSNNNNNNNNNSTGTNTTGSVLTLGSSGQSFNGNKNTYKAATVSAAGVTLSDATINGDLTVTKEVGDGTVTFNNLTVKGNVWLEGGGANSVIFNNCTIEGKLTAEKRPDVGTEILTVKIFQATKVNGDIIVRNNARIYTDSGSITLNKVQVDGNLTAPLVLDAHVGLLTLTTPCDLEILNTVDEINGGGGSNRVTFTLTNGKIGKLTSAAPVLLKGTGTVDSITNTADWEMIENVRLNNFVSVSDIDGLDGTMAVDGSLNLAKVNVRGQGSQIPTNKIISWTIDSQDEGMNANIYSGVLTARATGTVKLTATIKNGLDIGKDFSKQFTVVVTDAFVATTGIDGFKSSYEMILGEELELPTTVLPENATYKEITWTIISSGNTAGAKVNGNVVTATQKGEFLLRGVVAKGKDGTNDYTTPLPYTRVTVNEPFEAATGLEIYVVGSDTNTVYAQIPYDLTSTITPDTASVKTVTWKLTDNTAGATVANNRLTTTQAGKVTLTGVLEKGGEDGKDLESKPITLTVKALPTIKIEAENEPPLGGTDYLAGQVVKLKASNVPDELAEYVTWDVESASNFARISGSNKGAGVTVELDSSKIAQRTEFKVKASFGTGTEQVSVTKTAKKFNNVESFTLNSQWLINSQSWNGVPKGGSGEIRFTSAALSDEEWLAINWYIDDKPVNLNGTTGTRVTSEKDANGVTKYYLIIDENETASTIKLKAELKNACFNDDRTGLEDKTDAIDVKVLPADQAPHVPVDTLKDSTGKELVLTGYIMEIGDRLQLPNIISPVNATGKEVQWAITSGNGVSDVITLDEATNIITAVKQGEVQLTVTVPKGGDTSLKDYKKDIIVTVNPKFEPVTDIAISVDGNANLREGFSYQLNAVVTPTDATALTKGETVQWAVVNNNGTITEDGVLTPAKAGTVTVSATIRGGKTESGTAFEKQENFTVEAIGFNGITVDTDPISNQNRNFAQGQHIKLKADLAETDKNANVSWRIVTANSGATFLNGESNGSEVTLVLGTSYTGPINVAASVGSKEITEHKEINVTKFSPVTSIEFGNPSNSTKPWGDSTTTDKGYSIVVEPKITGGSITLDQANWRLTGYDASGNQIPIATVEKDTEGNDVEGTGTKCEYDTKNKKCKVDIGSNETAAKLRLELIIEEGGFSEDKTKLENKTHYLDMVLVSNNPTAANTPAAASLIDVASTGTNSVSSTGSSIKPSTSASISSAVKPSTNTVKPSSSSNAGKAVTNTNPNQTVITGTSGKNNNADLNSGVRREPVSKTSGSTTASSTSSTSNKGNTVSSSTANKTINRGNSSIAPSKRG